VLWLSSSSSWDYTRGISRAWWCSSSRRYQSIDRSIEGLARFVTHRSLSFSIGGRRRDLMMIVFDPAIFRLPVLRRRRCATTKLQRQPEVAIHDGRRGSQRGWVGGALDARGSNRFRVANERTAVRGKKRIPRKSRRCTHTEQIRPASSSTRLLPCRTRQGT
jgi:hypothetical protein